MSKRGQCTVRVSASDTAAATRVKDLVAHGYSVNKCRAVTLMTPPPDLVRPNGGHKGERGFCDSVEGCITFKNASRRLVSISRGLLRPAHCYRFGDNVQDRQLNVLADAQG
ncbi:hypothetical protein EVAR_5616_1 [Eumeta japonica]|uniref:Uncharacterized protein n=1 Tax=Eumeta variegata TaxID=151549 RepID=A0A4C1T828_EUMVA|nr:hypothetical protein EVAR_5616_1 [Eumeta japonica]